MSRYGNIFLLDAIDPDQFVGDVGRVKVHQPNPGQALDCLQASEEFGQQRPAAQVQAVERGVLGHEHQLPNAVGGQFLGLGRHLVDRLARIRAAHLRNRTETAQTIAPLGDLQVRQMWQRESSSAAIGQRVAGRRPEKGTVPICRNGPRVLRTNGDCPLFLFCTCRRDACTTTLCRHHNFVPGEDADQLVDLRVLLQKRLPIALGKATGDNHLPQPPLLL